MTALFVCGTDTGVGKTRVSVALLGALARSHARVVGMKPVAAGIDGAHGNDDVRALRAASNCRVPSALDNPVLLPDPLSPHIAAHRAGVSIDVANLAAAYRQLGAHADAVVVEGAGGFLVPLSETQHGGDLAQALGLPVLLVVGLRLGCLNHALLSAEAIRARGLTLVGWIANPLDPHMPALDDNVAYLRRQLRAPLWAQLPYQAEPDWDALVAALAAALAQHLPPHLNSHKEDPA